MPSQDAIPEVGESLEASSDQVISTPDEVIAVVLTEESPADVLVAETTAYSDIFNLFTETRYRTKLTDWWISLMAADAQSQTEMATADVE
jgi:hypothetical protein